jgi:hypothetical protein
MIFDPTQIDRAQVIKYSILVIVIAVAYFVVRNAIKKAKADAEALKLKSEIKPNELSFPLNQYVEMADSLEYAMDGAGTNEDVVLSVFDKVKTISDVLQLIQAFGVRAYSSGWTLGVFTSDYNLTKYIQADLTESDIAKVNSILLAKGINFSF